MAAGSTRRVLQQLRDYESRNVTFMAPDGSWPVVWAGARGCRVRDVEGRTYLDLTAAFGVAAAGHANPRVVAAGRRQMGVLLHAMGDVHPHPLKAELARALSEITFGRWGSSRRARAAGRPRRGKVIFTNSGFEAVEAALKTALLATGRPGVLAFGGAYHGLGYGALNATHREHFRGPFRPQLREFTRFIGYPGCSRCACAGPGCGDLARVEAEVRREFAMARPGAILVEPVQARGGIHVPPQGFLPLLRRLADEAGALLVLDEIYTGFGRTGAWFATEHSGTVPDLVCLGKALTGGFPLSACVGSAEVMDHAWPPSDGEAIHTSTFLGHPVGCAMALAQLGEIDRLGLVERSAGLGDHLLGLLNQLAAGAWPWQLRVRGQGLMAGLEVLDASGVPQAPVALAAIQRLLARGFLFLPEGDPASVISFTPPLTIARRDLERSVAALESVLRDLAALPPGGQTAPAGKRRVRR
ncbi:MAG: aspartate aminotransferase family protein [Verrucomicrobiota bacterium]